MTETEPEWTEEDRGWAIALLAVEADACSGCGQPLSESTAPDAEGRYEAPEPTRCHACTPLHKRQQAYADAPSGLMFEVERRR